MLSRFNVMRFWLTAGLRNVGEIEVFPTKPFRDGVKKLEVGFKNWPHTIFVPGYRTGRLKSSYQQIVSFYLV